MADENVIIEENEQNVGEYDPNPYDNVTVEEALNQLFNRFTPRTVRQAIFTMAENNKPATLIEKTVTSNDTYVATDDGADGYSKVTVDVAGGGGGGSFNALGVSNFGWMFGAPTFNYSGQCILMHSNDGNYKITLTIPGGITTVCVYLLDPANDINPLNIEEGKVIFTPGPNIRFINDAGEQLPVSGDEVTPSDGKIYILDIYMDQTTHKDVREVHKIDEDFQIVIN